MAVLTWAISRPHLAVLVVVTIFFQLYALAVSRPNQFPDSGVYFQTAAAIAAFDGNYSHFAYRTPGFPVFLLVGQFMFGEKGFFGIMALQFVLGLALPLFLYRIFREFSTERWAAVAGGLAFFADRFSVGMQTVLLTEWLSVWCLTGSLALFLALLRRDHWIWGALAGVALGLTILVRPSYTLLPLCLGLGVVGVSALYPDQRRRLREIALWQGAMVAAAYLVTLPWRIVLYLQYGIFALSFISGVALSNHMGGIMERAPDRYADVRDLYVQLRESPTDFIDTGWGVVWEHERRTGEKHVAAAEKLRQACTSLILAQPGHYLGNLAVGWGRIWTETPFYVTDLTDPYQTPRGVELTPFFVRFVRTGPLSGLYGQLDRTFWSRPDRLAMVPWLVLAAGVFLTVAMRRHSSRVIGVWALIGTIFYSVAVHIGVNNTEFGRYRLSTQVLWVGFLVFVMAEGVARSVRWVLLSSATDDPDSSGPEAKVPAMSGAPSSLDSKDLGAQGNRSKGSESRRPHQKKKRAK